MTSATPAERPSEARSMAVRLGLAAVAMFGFGFALVPLYEVFCEVTGIRIPIEASAASDIETKPIASRPVTLELLASNGAPWEFGPVADTIKVETGRMLDTTYVARNLTPRAIVGTATPDVRPIEAGRYFKKIECFCFTEQSFAAGEERELPVRFYIEPDLPAHIDTITLAYTLYEQPSAVADTTVKDTTTF